MLPLLAAGCGTAGPSAPQSVRRDATVLHAVIRDEKALLARYAEASRLFPALAGRLDPIAAQHREHLAALRRRLPPPGTVAESGSPDGSAPPPAWLPPPLPETADEAVKVLGADEAAAARSRIRRITEVTGPLAQLLASVGASEATHAALLSEAW